MGNVGKSEEAGSLGSRISGGLSLGRGGGEGAIQKWCVVLTKGLAK